MTYNVTSNKAGIGVTIHCTGNADISVLGDSSTSDLASYGETLTGAYITQIQWACPPGQYIRISRGGFLVGVFDSSSFIDFAGCGMPLFKAANKDLTIEFVGGGADKGFCNIELQKVFTELNLPDPEPDPPSFSILQIFSSNEPGVWYDPSDLSTLYQDAAGTVPVTDPGQVVGLVLDKSKGLDYPRQFFPVLPIEYGSGKTAIEAALAINAAIANSGVYYVKPSTGSDTNAGTLSAPFATVAKAMRTATGQASRVVMLEDCVISPFDLRSTDASQTTQQFKWLDANGFNVTIRVAGPDLSAQTWVQDATNTNCYKTTLSLGASQQVTRVLNNAVADDYGYNTPLRKYASAAALNAASDAGWFFDTATKVLWMNIGGNVEAAKSNFRALYLDTTGNARIFVSGAALGLSGVKLEGVQILLLDAASRRPEIWLHNVEQTFAHDKGGNITGWYVATNSRSYGSQADGCNGFVAWAGGKSLIQTVNCEFIRSGDRRVFDLNQTLQGVSAHGGCYHISFGTSFIENNGQGVADTCAASSTDYTWLRDCRVVGGAAGVAAANFEFGSAATSAFRYAYMSNCTSSAASGNDLTVSTNGYVQRVNTPLPAISGSAPAAYGLHAAQATAASKPLLAREPVGGRRNLLTFTEQVNSASWYKISSTVTANATTSPDGTVDADKLVPSTTGSGFYVEQQLSVTAGTTYTGSVFLKAAEISTNVSVIFASGALWPSGNPTAVVNLSNGTITSSTGVSSATITAFGNGWYRVSITQTASASGTSGLRISPTSGSAGNGTSGIFAWGAQLETGSTATAYQRVVSTSDVTEAGKPDLWYLLFDGIDDFLVTNTITPGTDKVQVFAGVRKPVENNSGTIIEFSVAADGNPGAFFLRASGGGGANYQWAVRSATTTTAPAITTAAPDTSVLDLLVDFAAPVTTTRRNGAQTTSAAVPAGGGNFNAYPLYIGRRAGTSLPFNGRLYGLITRFGSNLTATTVTQIETWMNSKTGAY